jgi:hypothetical protein
VEFVQSLRPEHLQSFWYFASKYCFALVGTFISLLWATALDKEEADLYKAKLDEYRWTLRLSSKSADFLERAISMLATSTGTLVKAMPTIPNPDLILNRRRSRMHSLSDLTNPDDIARENSAYQRSESEFHDETSPEQLAGETPVSTGPASTGWNADSFWFGGGGEMNSVDAVYNDQSGSDMTNAFMQMPDLGAMRNGFNFHDFSGQGSSRESGV